MAEYINVGTRVQIQTLEGVFLGTVVSFRDAHLEELNPPSEPVASKEPVSEAKTTAWSNDLQRTVTLYNVQLDDPTNYIGVLDGDIALNIYKFITPVIP